MNIKQLRELIKETRREMLEERLPENINNYENLSTCTPSSLQERYVWMRKKGIYDKGILKAVFTAGGPGSGKSYVADVMFDAREAGKDKQFDAASFVGRYGLKYVNSDNLFEIGLKKMGIPLADLGAISQAAKEGGEYKGQDAKELAQQIGLLGKRADSARAIAKG